MEQASRGEEGSLGEEVRGMGSGEPRAYAHCKPSTRRAQALRAVESALAWAEGALVGLFWAPVQWPQSETTCSALEQGDRFQLPLPHTLHPLLSQPPFPEPSQSLSTGQ